MSSDRHRSPRIGDRIAPHLTLSAVLGHGGMATVFEALHARLRAPVAVKIPMVSGPHAPEAERRLLSEAHLCARLDDPRFARIYDVAELEDGRPYFVMEKVAGPTLDAYLERRRLNVNAAVRIVRELLGALQVIHARGIVHRDIKPANIILQTYRGALTGVRLLDFGVARDAAPSTPGQARTAMHRFQGEVLGTPGYMPPEQIRSDRVDARADLFAVGVTLYEMLTGQLPFEEPQALRRMQRTLSEPIPDVRERRPACPAALAQWLATATATVPERRFESAEAALLALEEVRSALRAPAAGGGLGRRGSMRSQRRPVARRRSGLRALAAAAAGVVWLVASPLQPSQSAAPSVRSATVGETESPAPAQEKLPLTEPRLASQLSGSAGPSPSAAGSGSTGESPDGRRELTSVQVAPVPEADGNAEIGHAAVPASIVDVEPVRYPGAPLDGLDAGPETP